MVILLAVKSIAANQKNLIAVDLQNLPFNRLFGIAVILGVGSELDNFISHFVGLLKTGICPKIKNRKACEGNAGLPDKPAIAPE